LVYIDQFAKEVTEIQLHLNNINKEEGFKLGQAPNHQILQHFDTDWLNDIKWDNKLRNGQVKQWHLACNQQVGYHSPC
jgi:hypothetical protein